MCTGRPLLLRSKEKRRGLWCSSSMGGTEKEKQELDAGVQ